MNNLDDLDGKVIGGCRIERKIGQGGMGVVYKAKHVALDIPVALKLLLPSALLNPGAVDRFLQEARAAAKITSPRYYWSNGCGGGSGIQLYHYGILRWS